jgi:hypothetical protein
MFLRSTELKQMLIDLYKRLIVKQRTNIHLSDFDFPRKSLYDRLYPVEPDEATILRWVRGESAHSFFRDIFKHFPNAEIEKTKPFVKMGHQPIYSTPDVALVKREDWPLDVVFEFKSTVGRQIAQHWVQRLHRYMAVNDDPYGVLTVHFLLLNKIECFPIELPESKLSSLRDSIAYIGDVFEKGLDSKINPFPKCPPWMCRDCTHKVRCMRDFTKYSIKEVL